ncbi:MAG: hypothetical protein HQL11_03135 [Candidatus Omnitrophica bacterium]|nr:hypothetical protein [Candidatus Omnitrophota bacterium]
MNPIKKKAAAIIKEEAKKGMVYLEPGSACAKALKGLDIDAILEDDVSRICDELSMGETMRFISLVAQFKMASGDKQKVIKKELRQTAERVVDRVEKKTGKLKIPDPCRHFVLNL